MSFKKWVWSDQRLEVDGNGWKTKQTIHVAVVEDTRAKAEDFSPGTGVVTECSCSSESVDCCAECARMYALSPRFV